MGMRFVYNQISIYIFLGINGFAGILSFGTNPALFPKDLYFEALLRLPEAAYEQRAGQPLPRGPKYIYETGFNVEGWGDEAVSVSRLN